MSRKQQLWGMMALAGLQELYPYPDDINTEKVKGVPKTPLNKKQKKARVKAKVARQSRKRNRR